MTRRLIAALILASGLAWGPAIAEDAPDADAGSVPGKDSVKLTRVLMALPAGTPWLSVRFGLFCRLSVDKTWSGGREALDISPYAPEFKKELEAAGFKVVTPGETNLFEEELGAADYEAAAVITDAHINACRRTNSSFGLIFDKVMGKDDALNQTKGDGSMAIDWQIYARLKRQVVAHVSTNGQSKLESAVPGGTARLIAEAFADNVHQLASNADFQAAMKAPRPFAKGFQVPGQQSPIGLVGSLKAGPRKIADAVGSVVTIINGIGSGSAVLISSDGYLLTDAHVVGDDQEARVRWSDGIVTLGQVVRIAKNRDVAIIKTNPRDRAPLAIKRGPVTPGQRVYAIGSPRGKDFAGTVSSGVISADRVMDGLRYIQSDTTVSPGSSGGPLLDENGAVIGLTDIGFDNGGPAGLNLFTPIGDAMDFLSLEQK